MASLITNKEQNDSMMTTPEMPRPLADGLSSSADVNRRLVFDKPSVSTVSFLTSSSISSDVVFLSPVVLQTQY